MPVAVCPGALPGAPFIGAGSEPAGSVPGGCSVTTSDALALGESEFVAGDSVHALATRASAHPRQIGASMASTLPFQDPVFQPAHSPRVFEFRWHGVRFGEGAIG